MLPLEVRSRAVALRAAAQDLVKQSQQARDRSDIRIREAEAALFEAQRAPTSSYVAEVAFYPALRPSGNQYWTTVARMRIA